MKRVLFIVSHLCSGSDVLFDSLDAHPRIQGFREGSYESRMSLLSLASREHKLGDASAVYMDELLFNSCLGSKDIYPECHYVFLLRDPKDALNEIVGVKKYSPKCAFNHYVMRLRRMYSVARARPDSVLLTFSDLEAGLGGDLIADYLDFGEPVPITRPEPPGCENLVPLNLVTEAGYAFEHWLYRLRELGLRSASSKGQ